MVDLKHYSENEIVEIYSIIEEAVAQKKPINMAELDRVLKQGDFHMVYGSAGTLFTISGLRWIEEGEIYSCLIQPFSVYGDLYPTWKPVISVKDRDCSSSGMYQKVFLFCI